MADRTPSENLWSRPFVLLRSAALAVRQSAGAPGERWPHRRSSTNGAPDRLEPGPRGDLTGRRPAPTWGLRHRAAVAWKAHAREPLPGWTEDPAGPPLPHFLSTARARRRLPRSSPPSERAEVAGRARGARLRQQRVRIRTSPWRPALRPARERAQDRPLQGARAPKAIAATSWQPIRPGQVAARRRPGSAHEAWREPPVVLVRHSIQPHRCADNWAQLWPGRQPAALRRSGYRSPGWGLIATPGMAPREQPVAVSAQPPAPWPTMWRQQRETPEARPSCHWATMEWTPWEPPQALSSRRAPDGPPGTRLSLEPPSA